MIELPYINHWPARVLAKSFSEEELMDVIAYLQLVLTRNIKPSQEMFRLGINPFRYNNYEIVAVQHKAALAILYKRKEINYESNLHQTNTNHM